MSWLALLASPAAADVTALYEMADDSIPFEMTMTLEVSGKGDVRLQMANLPVYYLLLDGELYVVQRGLSGPHVIRMADQMQLQAELGETMFRGEMPEATDSPSWQFAPMGKEQIHGRSGIAYGIVNEQNAEPVYALLVISNEPALAPIGDAMQSMNTAITGRFSGTFAMLARANADMQEIIGSGAPLRISNLILTDVSTETIPGDRFALPGEPLTVEQLRAQLVPFEQPPTLPPRGE